ncbi:hypothetical protein ONZ45_g12502 [Pleurotus djamor]|nr:hypothetical protein ONZ45_g12502 [Pleurotus djamor]
MMFRRGSPVSSEDLEPHGKVQSSHPPPGTANLDFEIPKNDFLSADTLTDKPAQVVVNASPPIQARPQVQTYTTIHEHPRYKAIQRILLLNAYPFFYILLWMPGLANRLIEASGHKSKVTQIMQASTQFVGLANALTYGWNERVAREVKLKYRRRDRV